MKNSMKTYQENSYLTTLEAEVISCVKKDDQYEVILNKTIFYPHMSGGQPKDEGNINGFRVLNVIENNDEIIHILNCPLEGKVNLNIDYEIRFDHMQQHTGQHLLSHAIAYLYDGKTVGFHLSSDYTTIDINIDLNDEMIEKAENLANKIIYENKKISFQTLKYEEALKLNLRKAPPKFDNLRIMEIEDIEYSACGGTHVKNTGEVGIIKVIKTEKNKTGIRLYFLCGKRALCDYNKKNNDITLISNILTCGTDLITDNINKLKSDNKNNKKHIASLQSKLNEFYANDLKSNFVLKNDIKYLFQKYEDMDVKDLRYICSKIIEEENIAAFLISKNENSSNICIGQSKNLNLDIKFIFEKCKDMLNAKGGGNNKLMQATGDKLNIDDCLMIVKEILLK